VSLTFEEARDEIMDQFTTVWEAGDNAIMGVSVRIKYEGIEFKGTAVEPFTNSAWCRISIQHSGGGESLAGALGTHTYERVGVVYVQVFMPKKYRYTDGMAKLERLAMLARDAFEGQKTSGGVWFRQCRITEAGVDEGPWNQFNVMAEFVYDEVK